MAVVYGFSNPIPPSFSLCAVCMCMFMYVCRCAIVGMCVLQQACGTQRTAWGLIDQRITKELFLPSHYGFERLDSGCQALVASVFAY